MLALEIISSVLCIVTKSGLIIIQIDPQLLYFSCSERPYSAPLLFHGAKWCEFFPLAYFIKLPMVFNSEILCIKLFSSTPLRPFFLP